MKVYYEFGTRQLNKKGEELCGDSVERSTRPGWATLVLSDGLGSGVKANILSTLTTRIATRMLDGGLPLAEVVQTISQALPICRVRGIAYSTFLMAQLFSDGRAKLVEFDTPPAVLVRDGKASAAPCEERVVDGKLVRECELRLKTGDWLVAVSDGVVNAGIGGVYPLGWGWDELAHYAELHVHDALAAQDLAERIAEVVNGLYAGEPGDDVTVAVVKVRRRRTVSVMAGPPASRDMDEEAVHELVSAPGGHIVCGGTTSNIVARVLGRPMEVDLATGTESVPPMGRIEGIDAVTEGVLTLTKALELLRTRESVEKTKLRPDGASRVAAALLEADEVRFLLGHAMNPAHQDPVLPKELGLKAQVVRALAEELRAQGKEVSLREF